MEPPLWSLWFQYVICIVVLFDIQSAHADYTLRVAEEDSSCKTDLHMEASLVTSHSLLQRNHGVTHEGLNFGREGDLHLMTPSLGKLPIGENDIYSVIYADRVESNCSLGSGCSIGGKPSVRAVCVLSLSGQKECWDACNRSHEAADYQTGNVILDIQVQDSVNAMRNGEYDSVACPWVNGSSRPGNASELGAVNNQNATDKPSVVIHGDGCHWHPPAECVFNFTYKGDAYSGCPVADHHQPWCSHFAIFQVENWSNCKFLCEMDARYVDSNGLMLQNYNEEEKEIISLAASLDDEGYREVASLRSQYAMALLARRVVANMGCRVVNETALEQLIPRHSGEHDVQTFAHLEHELYLACSGDADWLVHVYPQNTSKQESLLSIVQPSESLDTHSDEPSSIGSTAEISEAGFGEVVQVGDQDELYKYIHRVIGMLHGLIVDESGLHGLIPFYDGEKAYQTLGSLILEIETEMQNPGGWVKKVSSKEGLKLAAEVIAAKRLTENTSRGGSRAFRECPEEAEELRSINQTAWNVPLSEEGYEELQNVSLNSSPDCGMMFFISRVIQDVNCHVVEESGLKGMVPFYSGTRGREDFLELKREILGVCKTSGGWLAPGLEPEPEPEPAISKASDNATLVTLSGSAGALDHGAKEHAAPLLAVARSLANATMEVQLYSSNKSSGNLSLSMVRPGTHHGREGQLKHQESSRKSMEQERKRSQLPKQDYTLKNMAKTSKGSIKSQGNDREKRSESSTTGDNRGVAATPGKENKKDKAKDSEKNNKKDKAKESEKNDKSGNSKHESRNVEVEEESKKQENHKHSDTKERDVHKDKKRNNDTPGILCRFLGLFCS